MYTLKVIILTLGYKKEFDKIDRPDKQHLFASSAAEKKLRFIHGHMSFHPAPRIQSAKSRPNLQSTSSVLDKQYQSSGVGIFDPIQLKNRNLCSQIDMGQERDYEVKAREREGWAMDKSNQQQRTKDHLYSDIFHVKYGEAAKAADRGLARNRQPEDLQ